MKITNKHGLPEAIVKAVSPKWGAPSKDRIGVTRLIDSPQIRQLILEYWDELEEDASGRLWALLGQLFHALFEKNAPDGSLPEEDLHLFIDDTCITGISDLYHDGIVEDYKVTSVWSYKFGLKKEVEKQLNVYAYMFRKLGKEVNGLKAHVILRDWNQNEALRYDDYPVIPFVTVEVPLWTEVDQLTYITSRIASHKLPGPKCGPEERWARPTTYAVMKKGRKTAVRVLDTYDAAMDWLRKSTNYFEKEPRNDIPSDEYKIVERKGAFVRCDGYCPVRNFCPQLNAEKEAACHDSTEISKETVEKLPGKEQNPLE